MSAPNPESERRPEEAHPGATPAGYSRPWTPPPSSEASYFGSGVADAADAVAPSHSPASVKLEGGADTAPPPPTIAVPPIPAHVEEFIATPMRPSEPRGVIIEVPARKPDPSPAPSAASEHAANASATTPGAMPMGATPATRASAPPPPMPAAFVAEAPPSATAVGDAARAATADQGASSAVPRPSGQSASTAGFANTPQGSSPSASSAAPTLPLAATISPAAPAEATGQRSFWSALCHASYLIPLHLPGLVITTFVWLWKRNTDRMVEDQGREAINMQLNFMAVNAVLLMTFNCFSYAFTPVVWAVGAVMSIMAAAHAWDGKKHRYPWIFRVIV